MHVPYNSQFAYKRRTSLPSARLQLISTMLWTALLLATIASAAEFLQNLTVDPYTTQCEETTLSWTGGVPPYWLRFNTDGELRDFHNIEETSWRWKCDYPAGTPLFIVVSDNSGLEGKNNTSWKGRVRTSAQSCPFYVFPDKNGIISAPPVIETQTVKVKGAEGTASSASAGDGNTSTTSTSKKTPVGAIVGGVVGGVVGALLLLGLLLWNLRLRRKLKGKGSKRNSYANIEDHTESVRQTTIAPVTATSPSQQPAPEPVHEPAPESPRRPSPPLKTMLLDTMYAPRESPSMDSSDSPTLPDGSSRSPRTRYTLDATSAPTSTNLHSSSQGHVVNNLSPVDDSQSEYAEDGGPAFPAAARTVHPPQYSDTWKT